MLYNLFLYFITYVINPCKHSIYITNLEEENLEIYSNIIHIKILPIYHLFLHFIIYITNPCEHSISITNLEEENLEIYSNLIHNFIL